MNTFRQLGGASLLNPPNRKYYTVRQKPLDFSAAIPDNLGMDNYDKLPGLAKRKLAHARELLAKQDFGRAMPIILDVAKNRPDELDSTLLALIPVIEKLVTHVEKHFKAKSQRFEQAWDDDGFGGAAA